MVLKSLVRCVGVAMVLVSVGGCHSAYVEADVKNATASPISLVEVDYPSASFGKETLAAGETYHYRFKILGDGDTKVLWTDTARHEHTVKGPALREGQEGSLVVTIGDDTAQWSQHLTR
jgi:hypothetical protein